MKSNNILLAGIIALALSGSGFANITGNSTVRLKSTTNQYLNTAQPYYVQYKSGKKSQLQAVIQQASVRSQTVRITHELDRYDAFVVMVPEQVKSDLSADANVTLIEAVPEHKMLNQVTPWNVDQYQARELWDKDRNGVIDPGAYDGSGLKVCIIDSGFYAAHSDFQGIFHTGESQISGELYTEDGNSHGTHVAGTLNAMNNSQGVVGVMPGAADLHIVKIFTNSGAWSSGESNLAAAAEACRDAGADVINMSLGGGPYSAFEESVFQDLYDNENMINVAAAGNYGQDYAVYPANYDSIISVGALDSKEEVFVASQHPPTVYDPNNPPSNVEWDMVELAGGGEQVLSTVSTGNSGVPIYEVSNNGQVFSGRGIIGSGNGDVTENLVDGESCGVDDINASWSGSVVLCERGNGAFNYADTLNNVADNGGLAVLIFQSFFYGNCNGDCTSGATIPSAILTLNDGQFLRDNGLGLPTRVFSDDGSDCVSCVGGYDYENGTSMAAPGVSGALSLIWNACGGPAQLTNKEVRQLARDSAKDLMGVYGPTNTPYGAGWDPYTGWGLPKISDAILLGQSRFGGSCDISGLDLIFESGFE